MLAGTECVQMVAGKYQCLYELHDGLWPPWLILYLYQPGVSDSQASVILIEAKLTGTLRDA